MGVMRLGYVHAKVTDLAESLNHYHDTLGMQIAATAPGERADDRRHGALDRRCRPGDHGQRQHHYGQHGGPAARTPRTPRTPRILRTVRTLRTPRAAGAGRACRNHGMISMGVVR